VSVVEISFLIIVGAVLFCCLVDGIATYLSDMNPDDAKLWCWLRGWWRWK
jgi:hypothetical protein